MGTDTGARSGAACVALLTLVLGAACSTPHTPRGPAEAVDMNSAERADRAPGRDFDAETDAIRALDSEPGPLALADMNGDQNLDLVVAASSVRVFLGDGTGQLEEPLVTPTAPLSHPAELAVIDQNLDGKADLFVAVHESNDVRLFLGDGAGALQESAVSPISVAADPHLHTLSVGDVDGDGRVDVLTDSWGNNRVFVQRSHGDGFTVDRRGFEVAPQPRNNVRLVDIDGDGNLDIVAPASSSSAVTVLTGDGTGGFLPAPGSPYATADAPFYVAFPDFEDDGRREILVAHRAGSWSERRFDAVTLLRGDDHGGYRRDDTFRPEVGGSPSAVAVCDLDGDAIDDAVAANASSGDLTLLYGGRAGSAVVRRSAALGGHPIAIACGDLDGDGRAEVVAATRDDDRVIVVRPGEISPQP